MITKYFLVALGFSAIANICMAADTKSAFQWPQKIKAAVSLSYDDAIDSQLDNAIPALNKYGLKGSFYLKLASPTIQSRLADWRAAAAQGHELGNHTLFHQCSRALTGHEWVKPEDDLDKTTLAQLKNQIMLANTMLYTIDGKNARTFTTPCGDLNAAGENYLASVKSEFVAIKSESGSGIAPSMKTLDPYAINVLTPVGYTGKQLIDVVKAAAAKGTMVNFTFHGVGGDYLTTSKEAHEELVKYLAEHNDIYWTDTFLNIMKYVKDEQKKAQ
ncbi:MAG: polysaccharide deacetylase [Gammaproteobacteria bacterium]|nr:MAG: polysaccharide deacetylase [Gammaproteobacteria bacterium]